MKMSLDLTKRSAYTDKTPYETWQETEGVPIYQGLAIDDLRTVTLAQWNRKGVLGAFINLMGAGRSCDSYACEIPPRGHTLPERYLFEELIYVVKGRGATSVWTEGGRKQTFEWQEGSNVLAAAQHLAPAFQRSRGRGGKIRETRLHAGVLRFELD